MSSSQSSSSSSIAHSGEEDNVIGAYGGEFLQYQDEPLASSTDASSSEEDGDGERGQPEDEDGIPPATLRRRFEGEILLDCWCSCEKCATENLVIAREYCCCWEVNEAIGKLTFDGSIERIKCIIQHDAYVAMVHPFVVEKVGPLFKTKRGRTYRRRAGVSQNEYLRSVAYRWLVRWIFGYLRWDNTRPLQACIYQNLRQRFPSAGHTGYLDSDQRI